MTLISKEAFALAQLRHLYTQTLSGCVHNTSEAARGLLGQAIEVLEKAHDAGHAVDELEQVALWLEAHARIDKTPEQAKILRDAAVGIRKGWHREPVIR